MTTATPPAQTGTRPTARGKRGPTRRTVEVSEKVVVIEPYTGRFLGWGWLVKKVGGEEKK
jgi:hypothetical protein